jgi:cell division protein FtsW
MKFKIKNFRFKDFFFDLMNKDQVGSPDWVLLGIFGFLIVFGLMALSSAGAAIGFRMFQDPYWHVKHQILLGLLPGLALFFFLSNYNYKKFKKLAFPLLLASIALLLLVFIPGIGAKWGTSHSWINLFGYSLQPSEIVKLTFLFYLAGWLSTKDRKALHDFHYGFMPFIFILLVVVSLLIMEPDTGTMLIIVAMSLAVYYSAGGRLVHLAWLSGFGIVALLVIARVSPYRAARLTTFLHPELDPLGQGYHINQALLAIGSGRLFGLGFGHSRQKFSYLPEPIADSVFAVICEEMGFFFGAALVALFAYLAWRGFKMAGECQDTFGRLLAVGIITWLIFQAFLNIGAIVGILPLTGVPLPFISYGGTALMTCLAGVGVLVNISKQTGGNPRWSR